MFIPHHELQNVAIESKWFDGTTNRSFGKSVYIPLFQHSAQVIYLAQMIIKV